MVNPYKKIINLLKENNIFYKETKHKPVYTSEQASKTRGISMNQGAKSLLLKCENNFVLVVLPGNRRLDSKKLKNILKIKKFRFASSEEVKNKMGCDVGACYPFGNIIGLQTYADNLLSKNDIISFSPGLHTHSIEIKWHDFYLLIKPNIIDISEKRKEA